MQFILALLIIVAIGGAAGVSLHTDLLIDPLNVPEHLLDAQRKVEDILEKTYKELWYVEENLREERNFTLQLLTKDVEGIQFLAGVGSDSLHDLFENDKNAKNIQSCLTIQFQLFKMDLISIFQKTTMCVLDVSQSALDKIEHSRQTFADFYFGEQAAEYIMENEWSTCLKRGNDPECITDSIHDVKDLLREAEKTKYKTLQKAKTASRQGQKSMDACFLTQEKILVHLWEKHAKIVGECISYSVTFAQNQGRE